MPRPDQHKRLGSRRGRQRASSSHQQPQARPARLRRRVARGLPRRSSPNKACLRRQQSSNPRRPQHRHHPGSSSSSSSSSRQREQQPPRQHRSSSRASRYQPKASRQPRQRLSSRRRPLHQCLPHRLRSRRLCRRRLSSLSSSRGSSRRRRQHLCSGLRMGMTMVMSGKMTMERRTAGSNSSSSSSSRGMRPAELLQPTRRRQLRPVATSLAAAPRLTSLCPAHLRRLSRRLTRLAVHLERSSHPGASRTGV